MKNPPCTRLRSKIRQRSEVWYSQVWLYILPWIVMLLLLALPVQGQVPDPTTASTIKEWAQMVFQLGIMLIVLTAAIFIAIGAYMYLAAAGNAETARTGKEYISRAIMGLVLGLVAWIILNTISTQFTELKDPSLK